METISPLALIRLGGRNSLSQNNFRRSSITRTPSTWLDILLLLSGLKMSEVERRAKEKKGRRNLIWESVRPNDGPVGQERRVRYSRANTEYKLSFWSTVSASHSRKAEDRRSWSLKLFAFLPLWQPSKHIFHFNCPINMEFLIRSSNAIFSFIQVWCKSFVANTLSPPLSSLRLHVPLTPAVFHLR